MAAEKIHSSAQVVDASTPDSESLNSSIGYDEKATKKLVRKIDLHILPVLVILYLLSESDLNQAA